MKRHIFLLCDYEDADTERVREFLIMLQRYGVTNHTHKASEEDCEAMVACLCTDSQLVQIQADECFDGWELYR